jgi:hypothetical protein
MTTADTFSCYISAALGGRFAGKKIRTQYPALSV